MSITVLDAFRLGGLIALFERAVGFYASLVNVNAYHQPGVEAGKKAAGEFLTKMSHVERALSATEVTAEELAAKIASDPEDVFHLLNHLAENGRAVRSVADSPFEDRFLAV